MRLRTIVNFIIIAVLCITSASVIAHSEHDKARFVAGDGVDTGRCDNRFRPCKTILYAAHQANKGDKILVAEGTYVIHNAQELAYLVSETHTVLGGYRRLDNYQLQQASLAPTVLMGVPLEYSSQLYDQGFDVKVDSKFKSQHTLAKQLQSMQHSTQKQRASTCENGLSSGFECDNVSLIAHLPLSQLPTGSSSANDIWGHVDLNTMKEYAILGLRQGVVVIEVSDPQNLRVIGSVEGPNTTWRDIKVYQFYDSEQRKWQAFAYVSSEVSGDRLSIIDLNNLTQGISLVSRTGEDASAHNLYISNVDYTTNTTRHPAFDVLLHVAGSNLLGGSFRSYSLASAQTPRLSYILDGGQRSDYSHDISSMLIDDERAQSDCVIANTVCQLILDFNESELRLWDHSRAGGVIALGSANYADVAYVHSGWWSDDKRFVIVHDELDERRFNLNTTVRIVDISDLNSPVLAATWTGPTRAVDHNGFTRGNRYYFSNYERGLTILDLADPLAPQALGYFDTMPSSNSQNFNGAWGVYPFLPSGNILLSDIQGGLFVLKDETLQETDTYVEFSQTQIDTSEGSRLTVQVDKVGNDSMSVNYELIYGSADSNDLRIENRTLTWANGDTRAQLIEIDILTDQERESDELFFVSLHNPQGGRLNNSRDMAFVTITSSEGFPGTVGFNTSEISVKEIDEQITLSLPRDGGSQGAITIDYRLQFESATEADIVFIDDSTSGSLNWQDGDNTIRNINLNIINDNASESTESVLIVLSAADDALLQDNRTLRINIRDDESNQAPIVNAGNDLQTATRQRIEFNASASDDGEDLSIVWTQTAGITVTLTDATTLQPSFTTPDSSTTLGFELRVTDDFGLMSTDQIEVVVNAPATQAPRENTSGGGGTMTIWLLLILFMTYLIRMPHRIL